MIRGPGCKAEGYTFQRWTGAAGGSANPLVINMNAATAISTEFVSSGSYAGWALAHFGDAASDESVGGMNADPDGDGRSNREEFALVSDPNTPHSVPQVIPGLTTIDDRTYFTLSWQQRAMAVVVPEVSTDLIQFTEASVTTISESEADDQGIFSKTIRMTPELAPALQAARLKIEQ